jgi:hypothetical protein
MPDDSVYVPALRATTPLGHAAIALLMAAALAPGASVVQMFVRFGTPPLTPGRLQSIVRPAADSESVIVCADE